MIRAVGVKGIINKWFGGEQSVVEKDMERIVELRKVLSDANADVKKAIEEGFYNPNSSTSTSTYTPTGTPDGKRNTPRESRTKVY